MRDPHWLVMKFGGTSVATAEKWEKIAALVEGRIADGFRIVVVHSAFAGVSNLLVRLLDAVLTDECDSILAEIDHRHDALARALGVDRGATSGRWLDDLRALVADIRHTGEVSPQMQARVLATGELAATAMGAEYLKRRALPVSWLDVRDVLRSEESPARSKRSRYLAARCGYTPDAALSGSLAALNPLIVTQGFIASNDRQETVLLGRGGSDTSAAYLAARLEARRLEIWTDVHGLFSANPKTVPTARLLRSLRYDEAQEIASAGGAVLHPRCITPVRKAGIPLFIGFTGQPESSGTNVTDAPDDETAQLKAISCRSGLTLVSMESMDMWQQVGFLAEMFACFQKHGISVDLVATSESNVTASIDPHINASDRVTLEALADDLRRLCRVRLIPDCTAVSLVGRNISGVLHDIGPALAAFEGQKMHLVSQAANGLNLTFVIDSSEAQPLVHELHKLLVDQFEDDDIFGPTWEELSASTSDQAL